jgi:hypothetical protein
VEPRDLYGLPLERFTEERNALAKQLRKDGQRDEASALAKLRKPSVAAWAVNQLVRTQRSELDALFKAGDELQKAQADLLAKRGDPGSLRTAVDSERAAVDRLVERARGFLTSDGHELTPARLEQVSETLHAAALDQGARAQVRGGGLDRELRHVGLGAGVLAGPEATTRQRTSTPRRSSKAAAAGEDSKERRARASAARKAVTDTRRQLEGAIREVKAAEARRHRAQSELREAENALAAARKVSELAARQHKQAHNELEKLG